VVHICNPSYLGGRDQEDHGLKPAWTNSLQEPILKKKKKTTHSWFAFVFNFGGWCRLIFKILFVVLNTFMY
jgi:hypothetical protein